MPVRLRPFRILGQVLYALWITRSVESVVWDLRTGVWLTDIRLIGQCITGKGELLTPNAERTTPSVTSYFHTVLTRAYRALF